MTFLTKYLAGLALRWLPAVRAAVTNPRVMIVALAGSLALAVTVEQARIASVRRHASVAAQVDIPPPPDSARIELHVAIDPIPIEARVSCSNADGQGIKTASVSASSPAWATVRFGRVEQSPDVCGSPVSKSAVQSHRGLVGRRLVLGIGRALTSDGWRWAMFAGAGIGIEL